MQVPLPTNFGEKAICNNRVLPFKGVSWFKWSSGMEYTYFFTVNDSWHSVDFYTTFDRAQKHNIEIPNKLLEDGSVKDKGFPLRGKGFVNGIYYIDGRLYVDFMITSNYYEHIKVQCDKHCKYVPSGDIIFPTSWDTEDKKQRAILKSIR